MSDIPNTTDETHPELQQILNDKIAPTGVVFEVIEWEEDALETVIPWLDEQINKLRWKFPKLSIAIVSHGEEQFALLKEFKDSRKAIHQRAKNLITDHGIKMQLCLGHAQMKNYSADDFPNYITIEDAGPARLLAYDDLGYTVITY